MIVNELSALRPMKTFVVATLSIIAGLYLLYRILDALDRRASRRRAKERRDAGEESICRWGFNAAGELIHIRCKRMPPED